MRRAKTRLLGHTLHVEVCLPKQFLRKRNAQTVAVFGDAHANVFVKQS